MLLMHPPVLMAEVRFVEVTKTVGINFTPYDTRSQNRYFAEPLGCGVAFLDYDNDSFVDIYFVNSAPLDGGAPGGLPQNALYRNNGDGTFSDVTQAAGVGHTGYGMGVCAGDYDNDGNVDLYVTNLGANVFYRNNGDGTFSDVTAKTGTGNTRWGAGCAFADYDNDGFLDLYVVNYVKYSLAADKVCVNKGVRAYCDPRVYEGESDLLYRNNGDGTFTDVTAAAGLGEAERRGLGVSFGDVDNDGDADIYVANDADANLLYRNNGDGTFTEIGAIAGVSVSETGTADNGMGVAFGDYNNDERLDIIVTNFQGQTNTLYRNAGDGLFLDVSYPSQIGSISLPYLAWGVSFLDYDNDGYADIFVANGHLDENIQAYDALGFYAQPNLLFHNRGDGTFEEVGLPPSGVLPHVEKVSRGLAHADYDNDGDVDVLVTNLHDVPDLLRNDGGNEQSWITVKLIGTRSNRDAIGARVKVILGKTTQTQEVQSGSSYLSQSDMRPHFGLGGHQNVDRLEIRWPSGLTEQMEAVQANQILRRVEGESK